VDPAADQAASVDPIDYATAILTQKGTPHTLVVDDTVNEDSSVVTIGAEKMAELDLFEGDYVLLKGKRKKSTIAVVSSHEDVPTAKIQMTKVVRSNLRWVIVLSLCCVCYRLAFLQIVSVLVWLQVLRYCLFCVLT